MAGRCNTHVYIVTYSFAPNMLVFPSLMPLSSMSSKTSMAYGADGVAKGIVRGVTREASEWTKTGGRTNRPTRVRCSESSVKAIINVSVDASSREALPPAH